MPSCWKCDEEMPDFGGRIPFKSTCEKCHSWLHSCLNCKNYCPGKPNDCLIPGTPLISDREKFNLCVEFNPHKPPPVVPLSDASSIEEKLFGKAEDKPKPKGKDRFNSFFGD